MSSSIADGASCCLCSALRVCSSAELFGTEVLGNFWLTSFWSRRYKPSFKTSCKIFLGMHRGYAFWRYGFRTTAYCHQETKGVEAGLWWMKNPAQFWKGWMIRVHAARWRISGSSWWRLFLKLSELGRITLCRFSSIKIGVFSLSYSTQWKWKNDPYLENKSHPCSIFSGHMNM